MTPLVSAPLSCLPPEPVKQRPETRRVGSTPSALCQTKPVPAASGTFLQSARPLHFDLDAPKINVAISLDHIQILEKFSFSGVQNPNSLSGTDGPRMGLRAEATLPTWFLYERSLPCHQGLSPRPVPQTSYACSALVSAPLPSPGEDVLDLRALLGCRFLTCYPAE